MGIAALVLGIVSVFIGFIPIVGSIAFIPALVGLILGIVDTVQKSKKGEKKGVSIAGIVSSAIAIVIISIWFFILPVILVAGDNDILSRASEALESQREAEEQDLKVLEELENKMQEEYSELGLEYDSDKDYDDEDYDDEDYDNED